MAESDHLTGTLINSNVAVVLEMRLRLQGRAIRQGLVGDRDGDSQGGGERRGAGRPVSSRRRPIN
jgi:hypothetical protein